MARRFAISVLSLLLTVLSLAPAPAACPSRGPDELRHQTPSAAPSLLDLASFLPRAGEVKGWAPKGETQLFKGEELFTYIDGGADIYNEYGFRQVITEDYENASQKALTLEVFEMADAAAAFGMFTFKSSGHGTEIALGQGGRLEDYYLNFWKGRVLVTVTGFDDSPESIDGVRRVAEATDPKIELRGEKPVWAAAFPQEWAARGGLKYLRGPIGLRNLHPALARSAIRFEEGVAGWPAGGVLAVVLRGRNPSESETAFSDAQKLFSAGPPFSDYRTSEGRFDARDAKGDCIQGRLLAGSLALLISKGPLPEPEKTWDRLGAALTGKARQKSSNGACAGACGGPADQDCEVGRARVCVCSLNRPKAARVGSARDLEITSRTFRAVFSGKRRRRL
jgi:hypothetical protein